MNKELNEKRNPEAEAQKTSATEAPVPAEPELTPAKAAAEAVLAENNDADSVPAETPEDPQAAKLRELAIRTQEIESRLFLLETAETGDYGEEIAELKAEQKAIIAEQRALKKAGRTGLDLVPIWMIIYGVVQIILNTPLARLIWPSAFEWILRKIVDPLNVSFTELPKWLGISILTLILFSVPILFCIISWLLYNFAVKKDNKVHKKAFISIWIIQSGLSLAMMIWIFVDMVAPSLK